jgi:UDP-3-O-[3-hydroxymyristoyl] N-acetylglucosamine deacetylase
MSLKRLKFPTPDGGRDDGGGVLQSVNKRDFKPRVVKRIPQVGTRRAVSTPVIPQAGMTGKAEGPSIFGELPGSRGASEPLVRSGTRKRVLKQTTLRDRVSIEGVGVHSGRPARISLAPAQAGSGFTFLRTGLPGGGARLIDARYTEVVASELCTVIGEQGAATLMTIEHALAALAGLGVDNALIEVDGPEVPILDGSSRPFVEAIDSVGIRVLGARRRVIKVLRPVRVELGRAFAELSPSGPGLTLDVEIDFATAVIGRQRREIALSPLVFREAIAGARTFGFARDVERLRPMGFALGASLENTVAIGEEGVLNPEGLRFEDEFVRHKILDAVGDLSLAGGSIQGHYRAYCPGHKLNVMAVAALFADPANYQMVEASEPRAASGSAEIAIAAAFAPEMK